MALEKFIADVLRLAHQSAMDMHAHDAARAILDVAQRFAHELAKTDVSFDRLRFISAATDESA